MREELVKTLLEKAEHERALQCVQIRDLKLLVEELQTNVEEQKQANKVLQKKLKKAKKKGAKKTWMLTRQ